MKRLALLVFAAMTLAGCDNPRSTVDQVQRDIATYKAQPSDAGQEKIEAGLAKLQKQIDNLESKGKTAEAKTCRSTEENLRADYRAARMVRSLKDAQSAIEDIGAAFKEAGRSIGDAFKKSPAPEP